MRVITIFFFLAFITKVQSQSPSLEFKAAYKQAKIDLKNKKYQEAKNKLEKLYQTNSSNSYSPYIQYFIAFANYQLENYQSAENELIKLQNSFANIEKKQDINYLLGLVYLRKKETENALTTFSKINNASFEKELNQEIQNYFAGNTNKKYIAELKIKYPNLKVLKELDSKPNIQNVYNLTENQIPYLHEKAPVNYQKGYYNIGLLLPFNLDSTQDSQTIGNQYVIDLYEGMLLATEKLKSEKINLKLHAYNIGNSQANMVSLLNNESFLSEDLLIGPLHNEANKIAQYYANNQKVAIINPLSTNKQLIDNKPFSFISKASSDGFVKQSVKFASSNFIGEFAVVYEESDDTIAKLYVDELSKNKLKYQLIKYQNPTSIKSIKKQFGAIFLVSQPKSSQTIIANIESKFGLVPIIVNRSIFGEKLQFTNANKAEIYIFNQDFVNENEEKIQNFKLEYWNTKNNIASYYTYWGYDLMLFWGRQISKNQENYLDRLPITKDLEGYLLSGFNYRDVPNENSAFTVTTIENGIETFYRKF